MKKALTAMALGVAIAAPAQAVTTPKLTVRQAHSAAKRMTESTLGLLLYRKRYKSAPVTVGRCRVAGPRGRCPVRVEGTSTCTYIAHVLLFRDLTVWGTGLRCH